MSGAHGPAAQEEEVKVPTLRRALRKRVLQVLSYLAVSGLILFAAAGSLRWPMAWAYLASYGAAIVISASLLIRRNPEVVAARAEIHRGAKGWDKVLAAGAMLLGSPVLLAVAGLDRRFGWTVQLPRWSAVAGLICALAGYFVIVLAMLENRHFEGLVRIQEERGHEPVTSGPYSVVRHPGYVGMLVGFVALPVVLGSLWALLSGLAAAALLILRTALEDRTLRRELPGYADYSRRVRYRLLPGIW